MGEKINLAGNGIKETGLGEKSPVIKSSSEKKTDSDTLVFDLLSPNKSIDLKIKEVVEEMQKSFVIILSLPRAQHELRYLRLVKYFADKGFPGIYLTLNKSTSELLEEMTPQKIDTKSITFLDAVTRMTEREEVASDNIIYLESPDDITELTMEADNALNRLKKGNGYFIVDSITTLLVYNNPVIVEKFLHTLSQKIKNASLQGVFLAAESTDKGIIDTISQFCDDIKTF